jgi:DUF4097 and DUF4098 domain-containing protein YvlB
MEAIEHNEVEHASSNDVNHREVDYSVTEGLDVEVRSASGNLRLSPCAEGTCRVRLTTDDPDPAARLAIVECAYDASANRLVIDTKAGQFGDRDHSGNFKSKLSRWFEGFRHDVDVELEVPASVSVRFRTASGDLSGSMTIKGLDVASASGDARLDGVSGEAHFNSASGDLSLGDVGGALESKSASGDVAVGDVSGDVNVQNVSGQVTMKIVAPVNAKVNSVSGDVMVALRAGLLVDLDASTLSGDLSSDIAFDGDGASDHAEPMLRLKVRTVSGDVRVRRGN